MESRFDYQTQETKIYDQWLRANVFAPVQNPKTGKTFSIIMPPPNANDPLHSGHAMFVALEDALIRFHRMLGDATVWIPGTDHAGIETQFVYEKKLKKQGQSRFDFDRHTLYSQIWAYVQENSGVAVDQIKKLGASADWDRFLFTLDAKVITAVTETFKQLAADKLVYRDLQLVHFCVNCGTSFSELEVLHVEQATPLFFVKYRYAENPNEYCVVATTRPEPIWADTHLAVHPHHKKTQHLIGKKVLNPLTNAEMHIIADEFVDPEFGTGIVKLTPAHDVTDYAVAKKLNLPMVIAIDRRGKMTPEAGIYAGLTSKQAREAVVADLHKNDLIEKIDETYQNRIGTCYRCGKVLEQLPLPQFFIKVRAPHKNLAQAALTALDTNETIVHGAGREKILRHWLENLHDWNISRQIVWGIRIPVWYEITGYEKNITVSFITPTKELKQGVLSELLHQHSLLEIQAGLQQLFADHTVPYLIADEQPTGEKSYLPETDTFDTWFSSAQWPVITLQTKESDDFARFYPTSVMETGYDILPFWVMRMMLLGIYRTGKSPFKEVYLHGLVRDEKGQKMSKSKGNVINPLQIVATHGADALRMALIIRSTPGQDKSVGEQDFKAARNFANKIWNASRFILLQHEKQESTPASDVAYEKQAQEKMQTIFTAVTKNMHELKLGVAADTLYSEFWHWLCDEVLEQQKNNRISLPEVTHLLITFLKLLHPFMPFVTEAVWQELFAHKLVHEPLLISSSWE